MPEQGVSLEEVRSLSPVGAHLHAPSGLECFEIACIEDDRGGDRLRLISNRAYQDPQARGNEPRQMAKPAR